MIGSLLKVGIAKLPSDELAAFQFPLLDSGGHFVLHVDLKDASRDVVTGLKVTY